MPDRRTVLRIVGITLAVLVVLVFGAALTIYLMARHRPAAYREPSEAAEAVALRKTNLQTFQSARRQAEDDFLDRGEFTVTVTADELNAAIDHYQRRAGRIRELDRLREVKHLQIAMTPGLATIMGAWPTAVGSVVVSVDVSVIEDRGPRLKVEGVSAGSLGVKKRRVQDMVRQIEEYEFVYQTAEYEWVRITRIEFGDGLVTVAGVREER